MAVDADNRVYNIEIQRSDKGAGAKRARYNSSLMDANVTEPGEKYENLCESYVIFITENDIMKAGLPIYHIDRTVKETGELFSDESHIIYVNSQIKDESALGKLMHDFSCTDAKDMKYKILADRVRYFKEDEKGVATMCKAMEEMRNEAVKEERVEVARQLLELGKLSYEEIAKSIYPGIYDDQMKITIRKHISNLKKKIGKDIKIRNVRPTGYIIEEDIL